MMLMTEDATGGNWVVAVQWGIANSNILKNTMKDSKDDALMHLRNDWEKLYCYCCTLASIRMPVVA